MKQSTDPNKLSFLASYAVIAIMVLLPFHALLTAWVASNFGHFDAARLWKEVLMVPLGIYAAYLVVTKPALLRRWSSSWLVWATLVYGLYFVIFGLTVLLKHEVAAAAGIYSLVSSLRFLWFMMVVWAICDTNPLIRQQWAKIVLIPAFIVVTFGLLQRFFLPADFLRHFGYGPNTIPPIETIDQKIDYRRVQSTLRGANPFGAYLILPIITAGAYVRRKTYLWVFLIAALSVLLFTFSRSAELGVFAAILFFGWHNLKSEQSRRLLLLAGVALVILGGAITWSFRNNDAVQNTLFHSDETSRAQVSSNSQRLSALKQGVKDIQQDPFGKGPGTAGPASQRNSAPPRIAENYFLQIGQEVGVVALALFIAINALVARELWNRTDKLSRVLLASLVGITVVNLVSHAWVDDTLSLLWWGLAGAALSAPGILNRKHHEQKAKTQKVSKARARTNS